MKRIDLTGLRFNKLLVLSYSHTKNGRPYWKCLCDCGNITIVCGAHLKYGKQTKSCGCARQEASIRNIINKVGLRYGRLVVIKISDKKSENNRHTFWECLCDCGNTHIVEACALTNENTISCGCFKVDTIRMITQDPKRNLKIKMAKQIWAMDKMIDKQS